MDGWRRNSWLDIENGSLEFLNEWFESPPRWCNCIRVVFVGTNRRIRGGTCCGKIKKRARKPCPSSLLEFRRGGNGIRIIFLRFFLYGKWMVGRRHWIEASKILKDVDEGWMEDGRRKACMYEVLEGRYFESVYRSRKLNNYAWKENGFLFLAIEGLEIFKDVDEDWTWTCNRGVHECFRYWKRAFTIHCSRKLKNYIRRKNEYFLTIEKLDISKDVDWISEGEIRMEDKCIKMLKYQKQIE